MITIAGSGPSSSQIDHVTVCTKKRPVSSDYVFCRFGFSAVRYKDQPQLMLFYRRTSDEYDGPKWYCDSQRWIKYYQSFSKVKPSTGLCAVFAVVERWEPERIGLIGFDWVLDGYKGWPHDSENELKCMQSLAEIVDLRD
jgi:hypothetical protein